MCRCSASLKLRHASSYGRPSQVVQPALNGGIRLSLPTREDIRWTGLTRLERRSECVSW